MTAERKSSVNQMILAQDGLTQDFAAAVRGCEGVVRAEAWKESGRFLAYSTSS